MQLANLLEQGLELRAVNGHDATNGSASGQRGGRSSRA
jgi:hypothetical protein